MAAPLVQPDDEHNRALVDNAHPVDWLAPVPTDRYNMVVIGGGTAGLVAALGTAALGGRVALVEKHLLGGDCLNFGCVPSKGVIANAHVAHTVRNAKRNGVRVDGFEVDFGAAMRRMRTQRAEISDADSAHRLKKDGVDVFLGEAKFTGPDTVEVNGVPLRFARACIATGARAVQPPIPGLEEAGVRTNEDIFDLTELPGRLIVIGAGPIGCEMAQSFARFGSEVTLVDLSDRILAVEEPEASAILTEVFREEGIDIRTSTKVARFSVEGADKVVHLETADGATSVRGDEILLAVGRAPNVQGLGLEKAGVPYDRHGVTVDAYLRTTNPRIYASGDVCSRYKFTHAADAMSRIVVQNALFFGRKRADALTIPWSTFTDPEVAHVGISRTEADERDDVVTFVEAVHRNDRSLLEGETRGYVRVHTLKNGTILGATVVGRHAGEIIAPLSLAITNGLGLGAINDTILPYPTRTEILKRVAGQWQRTKLTPFTARLLETV
ncbi:MAG: mercuric reductase, partial [Deltaproteobacteria bacterium]|nr:mercuric reductase [Deltaproteobacteria bacterium]